MQTVFCSYCSWIKNLVLFFLDIRNNIIYRTLYVVWFQMQKYLNCLLAKHVTRICCANISKSLKVVPHSLWIECMWFIEKTTNISTEFSCKHSQRLKLKSFSKFSSPNYVPSLVRVTVRTAAWAWDQLWLRPSSWSQAAGSLAILLKGWRGLWHPWLSKLCKST